MRARTAGRGRLVTKMTEATGARPSAVSLPQKITRWRPSPRRDVNGDGKSATVTASRSLSAAPYVAAVGFLALVCGHLQVAGGRSHRGRLLGLVSAVGSEAVLGAILVWSWRRTADERPDDGRVATRVFFGLDPAAFTRGLVLAGYAGITIAAARAFTADGLQYRTGTGSLGLAGFTALIGAAGICGYRSVVEHRSVADVLREVGAPVLTRTNTAVWFAVGAVLALPTVGLHGTVVRDADSARMLANVAYMRRHGLGLLKQTQDVWGPNATYWATGWIGGTSAARWIPILAFIVLSGTVCAIARLVSRSALVAIGATLALAGTPLILLQSTLLALYAVTVTLTLLAVYFIWTAGDDKIRARRAMLGALCLVLGAEAHAIGQIFFVLPALLVILGPLRRRISVAAIVYGTTAVLMIPRLLVNLSVGGTAHLRSNYDTYVINKGYLDLINETYYHHPVRRSVGVYASRLLDVFATTLGWQGAIFGVFAIVGLFAVPRRVRLLVLAFVAIYVGSMLAAKPAPYARYLLPLLPIFVLLVGFGLRVVAQRFWSSRPVIPVACITVISLVAGVTFLQQLIVVKKHDQFVAGTPLTPIDRLVNDGKNVIGVRSPQLVYVDSEARVVGPLFLSERDYVTYLTWPSTEKVLAMFARHDIGWIFIQSNRRKEYRYPASWLTPTYGEKPQFMRGVYTSRELCPVYNQLRYELWKVGSCPATDPRWATGKFVPRFPLPEEVGAEPKPPRGLA
jgi:hypothetical protein